MITTMEISTILQEDVDYIVTDKPKLMDIQERANIINYYGKLARSRNIEELARLYQLDINANDSIMNKSYTTILTKYKMVDRVNKILNEDTDSTEES